MYVSLSLLLFESACFQSKHTQLHESKAWVLLWWRRIFKETTSGHVGFPVSLLSCGSPALCKVVSAAASDSGLVLRLALSRKR